MATIADIAGGDPQFSILLDAVTFIDSNVAGSDLAGALSSPGSLTVFAPNNAAFGRLAQDLGFDGDPADTGAVTGFLVDNVDAATLNAVVQYHVLPGAQTSADLSSAGTFATLLGPTITLDGPTLVDQEPDLIDPSLLATDIPADNGIVHVIDRVLVPVDLPGNDAPTIYGLLEQSGLDLDDNSEDFDILGRAVRALNLGEWPDGRIIGPLAEPDEDLTVFAPNDGAFIRLAQDLGMQSDSEADAFAYLLIAFSLFDGNSFSTGTLGDIVKYHVVDESLQASQVLSAPFIQAIQNDVLTVDAATLSLQDGDDNFIDPALIATDIQTANGVVHVIDRVLLPDELPRFAPETDDDLIVQIPSASASNLFTGAGADLISASEFDDRINAGRGNDVVNGAAGDDTLQGGRGDDTIFGGTGDNLLFGGAGDDSVTGSAGEDTLTGGSGNDTLSAVSGHNVMFGRDGDDSLRSGGGNDSLFGGRDDDTIQGGRGEDQLAGGAGDDMLDGDEGNDRLVGGRGNDTLLGGNGNDTMLGKDGNDRMQGDNGLDLLLGHAGNDDLDGGLGADTLRGGHGSDTLDGGLGADRLTGGRDNDLLLGDNGADRLIGNAGDDTLDGGAQNDLLIGGRGADHFVFSGDADDDVIADFEVGTDLIDLTEYRLSAGTGIPPELTLTDTADGVLIDLNGNGTVLVQNVAVSDLTADDFLF